MTIEVLQSCMNISNIYTHIDKTKITSNAVIVSQGKYERDIQIHCLKFNDNYVSYIQTNTRGLSTSRNIAIENSDADICLLCDQEEELYAGYDNVIIEAFKNNPDCDIIAFSLDYERKNFPIKKKVIRGLGVLKISSVQIAFKRKVIKKNKIFFDEKMGAGTGNGAGEENKFLMDCLKSNLKIIYLPIKIAKINSKKTSSWFSGYDDTYFINRGWTNRRILGFFVGLLYILYFSFVKYKIYKKDCTFINAIKCQLHGFRLKR